MIDRTLQLRFPLFDSKKDVSRESRRGSAQTPLLPPTTNGTHPHAGPKQEDGKEARAFTNGSSLRSVGVSPGPPPPKHKEVMRGVSEEWLVICVGIGFLVAFPMFFYVVDVPHNEGMPPIPFYSYFIEVWLPLYIGFVCLVSLSIGLGCVLYVFSRILQKKLKRRLKINE